MKWKKVHIHILFAFFLVVFLVISSERYGFRRLGTTRLQNSLKRDLACIAEAGTYDAGVLRVLVLYSYYEPDPKVGNSASSNTPPELARANLQYFIDTGVQGPYAPAESDATFVFILNGYFSSVAIPTFKSNVHVYGRHNEGLEFSGYREALRVYCGSDSSRDGCEKYSYFIFINSSCRGPFLPAYLPFMSWTDLFTRRIDGFTKLVGININCYCCSKERGGCGRACSNSDGLYRVHVQSFFFSTDKVGLKFIRPVLQNYESKVAAVFGGEIGLSRKIFDAGYNIASMDKYWYQHNFTDHALTEAMCNDVSEHANAYIDGDHTFDGEYFGMTHHPFESVFLKTNRAKSLSSINYFSMWAEATSARQ